MCPAELALEGINPIDIMRNNFLSYPQPPLAVTHAEIVQATCDDHYQIGQCLFGIAKDLLHNAGAFHPRQGMLHANADP